MGSCTLIMAMENTTRIKIRWKILSWNTDILSSCHYNTLQQIAQKIIFVISFLMTKQAQHEMLSTLKHTDVKQHLNVFTRVCNKTMFYKNLYIWYRPFAYIL